MAMTINTNVVSLNSQRHAEGSKNLLSTSMERLSSGMRVNNAKDDAAGLAIAERMNAQVKGINVAIRNANDGISLAQTAEGALATVTDALQRMRELAVQSKNATNTASDRSNLDAEFKELGSEINRIKDQTKFNGITIIGASAGGQTFQVGAATTDTLTVTTTAVDVASVTGTDLTTADKASSAIGAIDTALDTITTQRANYGASISRLGMAINNLTISGENQAAARGRIVDADFAAETANLSRAQILQQAGTAMISQANQLPNQVMSLLR